MGKAVVENAEDFGEFGSGNGFGQVSEEDKVAEVILQVQQVGDVRLFEFGGQWAVQVPIHRD
jgi:hypothetical protein